MKRRLLRAALILEAIGLSTEAVSVLHFRPATFFMFVAWGMGFIALGAVLYVIAVLRELSSRGAI